MFAPYCTSCRSRILLGIESVVAYDSSDGHHAVVLRCRCGRLLSWDAQPPPSTPRAAAPVPTPTPSRRWLGLRWAARPAPPARRPQPVVGATRAAS
jgi:hypothetical protein